MDYDKSLDMVLESEDALLQHGLSPAAIVAGKNHPDGFVATMGGINYFISKKVHSYALPDQFGDRGH